MSDQKNKAVINSGAFGKKTTFASVLPDGSEVVCSPVTMRDDRILEKAYPRPMPPVNKRQPGKGSAAPLVENNQDPEYLEEISEWYDRTELARLAISIGYQTEQCGRWDEVIEKDNSEVLRWICEVSSELEEKVTSVWVGMFNKQAEKESTGSIRELVDRAGRGNSGTPSD